MSRQWQIDFDRPLSEDDKAFLMSRGGHEHLVHANEQRFGEGGEEDPGPNLLDQIAAMDEKTLNAHLKDRKLPTTGKLQDRRDRLAEYVLENEAEDDGDEDDDDEDDTNN